MTIFLCDDTMEGIFTAVYDAWASRLGHANVKLQVRGGTMELFADYREAETDMEKAEKVARTIKRELGGRGMGADQPCGTGVLQRTCGCNLPRTGACIARRQKAKGSRYSGTDSKSVCLSRNGAVAQCLA